MIITIGNYQVAVSKVAEEEQAKRLEKIWQQKKIREEMATQLNRRQLEMPGTWLR